MKNVTTESYTLKLKDGQTTADVVKTIQQYFPQIKAKKFKYKPKSDMYIYPEETKVTIDGSKITIEKLTLQAMSIGDNLYCNVTYTLDAPRFGIGRTLVILIGLCFGIIPGLVLFFLLCKSDDDVYIDIAPTMNKLGMIFSHEFDGKPASYIL